MASSQRLFRTEDPVFEENIRSILIDEDDDEGRGNETVEGSDDDQSDNYQDDSDKDPDYVFFDDGSSFSEDSDDDSPAPRRPSPLIFSEEEILQAENANISLQVPETYL